MFTPAEASACDRLVALALEEDLGLAGDVTCQAVVPEDFQGRAVFVARSGGVVAGLPAVERVFAAVSPDLKLEALVDDGSVEQPGSKLALASGPLRALLA